MITTQRLLQIKNLLSIEHEISLDTAELLIWSAVMALGVISSDDAKNDAFAMVHVRQMVLLAKVLNISKEKIRAASTQAIACLITITTEAHLERRQPKSQH